MRCLLLHRSSTSIAVIWITLRGDGRQTQAPARDSRGCWNICGRSLPWSAAARRRFLAAGVGSPGLESVCCTHAALRLHQSYFPPVPHRSGRLPSHPIGTKAVSSHRTPRRFAPEPSKAYPDGCHPIRSTVSSSVYRIPSNVYCSYVPFPDKLTQCVPLKALSWITTYPVRSPAAVGVNVT